VIPYLVASTILIYPLDVATTLMTMDLNPIKPKFRTFFDCLNNNKTLNGRVALYKGLCFSLCSMIPYNLFMGLSLYSLKQNSHTKLRQVISNSAKSLCAGVLLYPLDTIKRNLQGNGAVGNKTICHNSLSCGMMLYKSGCLYNGLAAWLLRYMVIFGTQYCGLIALSGS
jgi:Mitochondrial carrier protein